METLQKTIISSGYDANKICDYAVLASVWSTTTSFPCKAGSTLRVINPDFTSYVLVKISDTDHNKATGFVNAEETTLASAKSYADLATTWMTNTTLWQVNGTNTGSVIVPVGYVYFMPIEPRCLKTNRASVLVQTLLTNPTKARLGVIEIDLTTMAYTLVSQTAEITIYTTGQVLASLITKYKTKANKKYAMAVLFDSTITLQNSSMDQTWGFRTNLGTFNTKRQGTYETAVYSNGLPAAGIIYSGELQFWCGWEVF